MITLSDCSLALVLLAMTVTAAQAGPRVDSSDRSIKLTNGSLELVVDVSNGINPCSLRDMSGIAYADSDYAWPGGKAPSLVQKPSIRTRGDGSMVIILKGRLGAILVEHTFEAPAKRPGAILERIRLTNKSDREINTTDFRCGFVKRLKDGDVWLRDGKTMIACPIPYRRETDGSLREYTLRHMVEQGTAFVSWHHGAASTTTWGAEGWALTNGGSTLLVSKYNPNSMEWALISPTSDKSAACFGGAGLWKHEQPEKCRSIDPGKSISYGETLYQVVAGDWKPAYYAFRSYMESKCCRIRKGYNPPVQWNELYENEYYWANIKAAEGVTKVDEDFMRSFEIKNKQLLKELFTLDMMKAQAAKAKEIGCDALYLDPGWDTGPGTHVWDAERLGTTESFLKTMRDDFGLRVCVWIPIAGATDPFCCPPEARLIGRNGNKTMDLCVASPAFRETKVKALKQLGKDGIAFLLVDATQYTQPCYSPAHGHSVPSTLEEHAQGLMEIIRQVKEAYPKMLIEWHDPVTGPNNIHYTPSYFAYARPHSFDELWGHEFMWDSMGDLLSGRAISLYYYNLAHSIPMYLHVALKSDNANALVFWWYASTIRHLGIGGQHSDPKVWEAHKAAMKTYMSLKPFFTQGAFYGLDETIHAHTLANKGQSVINVFNLTDADEDREITFTLPEIGLWPGDSLTVDGADSVSQTDRVSLSVKVPAKGHRLIRVSTKA